MDIPADIWEIILGKCSNEKTCNNLYKALPIKIQKELEPSYNVIIDFFKDIYIVYCKSLMIVFKDDSVHKIKDFDVSIRELVFSKFKNEVIVVLENEEIFYYNFETNYYYTINIPENEIFNQEHRIFAYLNYNKDLLFVFLASNYEMNFFKYIGSDPEYLFQVHKSNVRCKKKFMVKINDCIPEITTYFHYKIGDTLVYDLKLINHETREIIYTNNEMKITSMCFDDYSNFVFCDSYAIYMFNRKNREEKILSYFLSNLKIDNICAQNKNIYYSIYLKDRNVSIVYYLDCSNFVPDCDDAIGILEVEDRIQKLKISFDNNFLIVGTKNELFYFDLENRKIKRKIDNNFILQNSYFKKYYSDTEKYDFDFFDNLSFEVLI